MPSVVDVWRGNVSRGAYSSTGLRWPPPILPLVRLNGVMKQTTLVRAGERGIELKVPKLTNREIRFLDRSLPEELMGPPHLLEQGIPVDAALQYALLYRLFPAFVGANF